MVAPVSNTLCADCREKDGSLEIRKRHLCPDCFSRYVYSKVLKRMESYRFKHVVGTEKRRLLLPLSGGVSSLVLLHVLDSQLQRQLTKQNRTAYDLIVVNVNQSFSSPTTNSDWYDATKQRFLMHKFLSPVILSQVMEIDSSLKDDLSHIGVTRNPEQSDADVVEKLWAASSSVTCRADLQTIFLRRLLVALGKQHQCESILWGHSDSRLASLSLAGVAKGRGGSIPNAIADGPSFQGIDFNYPMRDLFKTELEMYSGLPSTDLSSLMIRETSANNPKVSIKNTSIDDLLTAYITSQGEKYPSIMANVVRTTSKLQVTKERSDQVYCVLCREAEVENSSQGELLLCYACKYIQREMQGSI